MGNFQLIGHQLIGMLTVCLAEIFMKLDAMTDGQYSIGSIYSKEYYVSKVLCVQYQFAKREKKYERDCNRAHIASKTFGLGAEVEETEHQQTKAGDIQIRH